MLLEQFKAKVSKRVRDWAETQGLQAGEALAFTQPPPHLLAELSLPWPLQAAKELKRKPLDIAGELAGELSGLSETESIQASPPGFVNFKFKNEFLCRNLEVILKDPAHYGMRTQHALEAASKGATADALANKSQVQLSSNVVLEGARKRSILIEFVSANPTGPLHLASGRAATLGDSLARILKRIGHPVLTEYYVNDAGRQVELLGLSVRARWGEIHGRDIQMPEDGYQGEYIKSIAANAPKEADRWEPKDFSRFAIDQMLSLHRADMDAFGVNFDRWSRESELHARGALTEALDTLKKRGMVYEKEGAVWLGTASQAGEEAESADDKDRVLIKSGGQPTYFLADIAYHKEKYSRAEELIDILGADHHGYVPRLKAAVIALGKTPDSFHAIVHQLVHLYHGKELVKMSKRAGEFVTLKELIDEVGRDACRFFFAMRTPNAHMNFDLELAKKQSQENPVYYVQYVHARIASIFREAIKAGIEPYTRPTPNEMKLSTPEERALLVKMLWFPEALADCEKALSPHPLATYLLELAGLYHPFYEKCRVVDISHPEITQARLALCAGAQAVIAQGLELLGVFAPESM